MDYTALPRVDRVAEAAGALLAQSGEPCVRRALVQAARDAVEALRASGAPQGDRETLLTQAVEDAAARYRAQGKSGLRRVLNASGVVLHTNRGGAPLAPAAVGAGVLAAGY